VYQVARLQTFFSTFTNFNEEQIALFQILLTSELPKVQKSGEVSLEEYINLDSISKVL
jgi:hypothetical protein